MASDTGHGGDGGTQIFVDKHLAYSTTDAIWMWERSRQLGIPLMAGSSIPTLWRRCV